MLFKLGSYIKKRPIYISVGLIVLLALSYIAFGPSASEKGEIVIATMGNITEEVFITGTVEAARKVSLSFDRSGSIKTLPYPVGTMLPAGTIITSLQNETEAASLAENEALVAIEEAKLEKLHIGTRSEELKLKEAELREAEVALQNTESKTSAIVSDAYSATEEAINRYADPFFASDDTTTPRLTYSSGTQSAYDAETARLKAGTGVKEIQKLLTTAPSLSTLEEVLKHLRTVQDLFITLGLTLRDGNTLEASLLADYRSRVTTARSALTDAITLVQDQMSTLRAESAELERAKSALVLAKAKATPETVKEAQQELAKAQAKLRGSRASFEKTLIRAPFSGKIASKNVEIGETVSSADTIVEFLGADGFIIEASVSESDITQVTEGDRAEITLDAYGKDVVLSAHVIEIEPTATLIDGVSTYKTTFALDDTTTNIRSGMTANVTIRRVLKENALTLPSRAITTENGTLSVMKINGKGPAEKTAVTLGTRNGSGIVEILSGLSAGDSVLIPLKK